MASYGNKRLGELIKRLNLASAREEVEWQMTDNPASFLCIFDGPSVEITSADQDGSAPYVLRILNAEGNVIESFRSNNDDPWADDGSNDLDELYERARRSATNVDDILDSILNELPQFPPPAKPVDTGFTDEPPF